MAISPNLKAQCWTNIKAGTYFTLGIKTDGTLWATGNNSAGQLGLGDNNYRLTFTQVGITSGWVKIAARGYNSAAIKSDGSLWTWGANSNNNTPIQKGLATDWKEITIGDNYFLAIKTDGTLWSWGANNNGCLGDGSLVDKINPVQIGNSTDWLSVSAYNRTSFAIKTNGTLWAWGFGSYGQLGNGAYSDVNIPTQVGTTSDWLAVATGSNHVIALKNNGTIWSWGSNIYGEAGTASGGFYNASRTKIGSATDWLKIDAGASFNLALKNDGTLWSWGLGSNGSLGLGANSNQYVPAQVGTGTAWSLLAAGFEHSMVLNATLNVFGSNSWGCFGTANLNNSNIPLSTSCATLEIQKSAVAISLIYPNPVGNTLNLQINHNLENASLKIVSILGETVFEKQNVSGTDFSFDVSEFNSGLYLVQLKQGNLVINSKFIKQ